MTYDPQKIEDHVDQGLDKFLEQFKNKTDLNTLLTTYLNRVQELEDAIWEVLLIRGIEESEGINLDVIGKVVGRARMGLSDLDYRVALRAQIRINRSSGRPEDLIDVTRLSISSNEFEYTEAYPATVLIEVLDVPAYNILVLLDNLLRAKAGGVRLLLEYPLEEGSEGAFTFSIDDVATTDTDLGFGDDLDPSIGGYLTDVIEG